jgi:cytochrome c-type biogenesis protein CcmE
MGRKKFLIGAIIILVAAGSLGFMAFRGAATYYYTVSEALAKENTLSGQNIRVAGQVAIDSVVQDGTTNHISFVLLDTSDSNQSLAVRYQGEVPDAFKAGNDAVVEGHLSSPGIFEAQQIIVKCPSKYEPKQQ